MLLCSVNPFGKRKPRHFLGGAKDCRRGSHRGARATADANRNRDSPCSRYEKPKGGNLGNSEWIGFNFRGQHTRRVEGGG